jgi:dihydrofolate synthase/folylpolyglutamate synthase
VSNSSNPDIVLRYEQVLSALLEREGEHIIEPSLDRIKLLLEYLGNPETSYRVVHVAGTNGKTSTSRMIESMLMEAGLIVGMTTSPHLHDVRERIRMQGQPIDFVKFIETYEELAPYLDLVDEKLGTRLSYFEVMTAMAFAAFSDAPVDVAVIEVGLGGSWDATNVVNADVCVITPIDLDHQKFLGDTIAEIAAEKAGIIKENNVVVSALQNPVVAEIIQNRATQTSSTLFFAGQDFDVAERTLAIGGQLVSIRGLSGQFDEVVLPLLGQHQAANAALAVAAVEAFFGAGLDERKLNSEIVEQGLGNVTSPGRLEVIRRGPTVLVDVAHNPHGAQSLANALESEFDFQYLVAIVGMFGDKDARNFLDILQPRVNHLIVTQTSHERALAVADLHAIAIDIFEEEKLDSRPDVASSIEYAIELADAAMIEEESGVGILVTGSVYTVAQARALLGKLNA